jgi:glycosyltransferase involved in cell wall biosynthesis
MKFIRMDANWIPGNGEKNLVSVIIPTYNRAALLEIAIESIIEQSYRPIECIVVDDGSTDTTPEIMRKYEGNRNDQLTIQYIIQKNAGSQVARNTGTKASTGEYIQYLDSDDLLYPQKLENQVKYLQQNQGCDGVFGDWRKGLPETNEVVKGYASEDLITQMLIDRCVANFSFLMRRSIVSKTGAWDPAIRRNQEIDFHIRGLLAGARFEYQSCDTGLWRMHASERIANTTGLNDVVFFYQKMEHLLNERQLFPDKLKEKIASLYMWLISQYIDKPNQSLVHMLGEAVRLNPTVPFYSGKMKWLAKILGQGTAFNIWLSWFRFNQKRRKG